MEAQTLPCPDNCGGVLQLRPSRYGLFYGCTNYPSCRATHGAHPDGKPLGVPANKATKEARIAAHDAFDKLWRGALALPCYAEARGDKKRERIVLKAARTRAYRWLAEALGIEFEKCHIGAFDGTQCARTVLVCAGASPATVREWAKNIEMVR